jgi:hypothetical protein
MIKVAGAWKLKYHLIKSNINKETLPLKLLAQIGRVKDKKQLIDESLFLRVIKERL